MITVNTALAGWAAERGDNIGLYTCGRTAVIDFFGVGSWRNNQSAGTRPLLALVGGDTWRTPAAPSEQLTNVDWELVYTIRPC
ncbi:hypothetical protein QQY24_33655 [Streptomyces sp. TG1A-8]|uniref:hypothetical protein n=1 Tax=Streptomyces sp. TG1A-8 TaxID=3051385 RepID=UPI00265C50FA|nr:hypothetical protein [Streptomyces sp. TG1A-8]MDO0930022.1 hypothetical protein [Streptomyces sp. TG1A-8]